MMQANRSVLRLGGSNGHRGIPVAFNARSLSRRQTVVRANWGAPVDFSSAKVVRNKQLFPGMHQLVVDVGPTIAAGYSKPGQYIQAKVAADNKPGFFAIASGPSHPGLAPGNLELLIKSQPGATAEAIVEVAAGGDLLVSPVQGKGFPIDKIPASEVEIVLCFATGSGISPLKAVIESGLLQPKQRKQVHLFYGSKNEDLTAYQEQISSWQSQGIKVTQVFSGVGKQYVQGALEAQLKSGLIPAGHEAKVGVLLCGQKDMCTAVTTLLTDRGISKDRILTNF